MVKNKPFLIVVLAILIFTTTGVGTVSAQDGGGDGIVVDDEFLDENTTIDTVTADSGTIRIGDVEWDAQAEQLTFTIANRNRITNVNIIDQAGIVGSTGFRTIPATQVQLGPGEAVRVTIEASNHVEYGQVITVSDGQKVITLTNEEPQNGTFIRGIGASTWFAGGALAFLTTGIAAYIKIRNVRKAVTRVA